jgi:hypothetical protein
LLFQFPFKCDQIKDVCMFVCGYGVCVCVCVCVRCIGMRAASTIEVLRI